MFADHVDKKTLESTTCTELLLLNNAKTMQCNYKWARFLKTRHMFAVPSTWKAEAGGVQIQAQTEKFSDILS